MPLSGPGLAQEPSPATTTIVNAVPTPTTSFHWAAQKLIFSVVLGLVLPMPEEGFDGLRAHRLESVSADCIVQFY